MLLSEASAGKSAAERMMIMDQIVATYGLTKRYKDFCAVSQLDMTVREIAKEIGKSKSYVAKEISKAEEFMKKLL